MLRLPQEDYLGQQSYSLAAHSHIICPKDPATSSPPRLHLLRSPRVFCLSDSSDSPSERIPFKNDDVLRSALLNSLRRELTLESRSMDNRSLGTRWLRVSAPAMDLDVLMMIEWRGAEFGYMLEEELVLWSLDELVAKMDVQFYLLPSYACSSFAIGLLARSYLESIKRQHLRSTTTGSLLASTPLPCNIPGPKSIPLSSPVDLTAMTCMSPQPLSRFEVYTPRNFSALMLLRPTTVSATRAPPLASLCPPVKCSNSLAQRVCYSLLASEGLVDPVTSSHSLDLLNFPPVFTLSSGTSLAEAPAASPTSTSLESSSQAVTTMSSSSLWFSPSLHASPEYLTTCAWTEHSSARPDSTVHEERSDALVSPEPFPIYLRRNDNNIVCSSSRVPSGATSVNRRTLPSASTDTTTTATTIPTARTVASVSNSPAVCNPPTSSTHVPSKSTYRRSLLGSRPAARSNVDGTLLYGSKTATSWRRASMPVSTLNDNSPRVSNPHPVPQIRTGCSVTDRTGERTRSVARPAKGSENPWKRNAVYGLGFQELEKAGKTAGVLRHVEEANDVILVEDVQEIGTSKDPVGWTGRDEGDVVIPNKHTSVSNKESPNNLDDVRLPQSSPPHHIPIDDKENTAPLAPSTISESDDYVANFKIPAEARNLAAKIKEKRAAERKQFAEERAFRPAGYSRPLSMNGAPPISGLRGFHGVHSAVSGANVDPSRRNSIGLARPLTLGSRPMSIGPGFSGGLYSSGSAGSGRRL